MRLIIGIPHPGESAGETETYDAAGGLSIQTMTVCEHCSHSAFL
jgi:hypothetical protein